MRDRVKEGERGGIRERKGRNKGKERKK